MGLSRRVRRGVALGALALALAVGGCGRNGRLEPPPDPSNPFAYGYPPPPPADPTKPAVHRRPENPPIKPPREPFLLDPLL